MLQFLSFLAPILLYFMKFIRWQVIMVAGLSLLLLQRGYPVFADEVNVETHDNSATSQDSYPSTNGGTLSWIVNSEQFTIEYLNMSGYRQQILIENALMMNSELIQLSPDGTLVTFVTAFDRGFRDSAIWLIRSDGSERRKLVDSNSNGWVTNPVWSPDSRQFAYVRVVENEWGELIETQLWLHDLETSQSHLVTNDLRFTPILIFGVAKTLEWTETSTLYLTVTENKQRRYAIDMVSGTMNEIAIPATEATTSTALAHDCQNMIKPVNVRDYDGSIGRGYTTAYLDKYTLTAREGEGSHPGVDIAGGTGAVGQGTPVVAIANAYVFHAGYSGSWGYHVVLQHDGNNCEGGVYSIYAHLQSQPSVSSNTETTRGTEIGRVGCTPGGANCTGPHLHFQIDKSNTAHPFWMSASGQRAGQCQLSSSCPWNHNNNIVNNPDTDNQVKEHTHSPIRFIQARTGSGGNPTNDCTTGEGVILYEHSNYTGRCSRFTGDDNDLGNDTIGQDAASSIRVIGNFQAVVYENNDFGDASSTFVGDDPDLGNDEIRQDRASSLRVQRRDAGGNSNCDGGQGVYLYENGGYQGRCSKFTGDSPNPRNWYIGNDAASSIKIVGSYEAIVYQDDEYNGANSTFTADDSDLGNDVIGNDQVSSLRVHARNTGSGSSNCDGGEGVYLYEHSDYGGRCSKLNSDAPNPGNWYIGNDTASSIRLIGNYETTVYEHDAYNGANSHFVGDDPNLGNDAIGQDNVSSIRVGARQATSSGPTNCDNNQFLAEYFNNRELSGSSLYRRCEGAINQNWEYNGPGSGINADNFSVRWAGNFWFENDAVYKFTVRTDDGVRFWLDNQLIFNEWRDMGATTFTTERSLSAGMHTLRLDYYENAGYATAQLTWERQSQPQTATDPDDNRTLSFDQGLDGTVNPANDRDDYYFDGAADQAITIHMDKRDSNLDSYIELYNPDGTLLGQDDDSGNNQNSRLAITLRQNGRHKIIARGYQASIGGYRLSLSRESTADPDDNRWITLGGNLQGTISPNNDRDWYYFAGVANRSISIRMNKLDAGLDSFIELYSSTGVKLVENDDGGNEQNSWLVYTLPSDGNYRILARSYNLASNGQYKLAVATVSNNNLAQDKSVWATSTQASGAEPYKATDGNRDTRWSSRFEDPQLLYIDLGSTQTFNQVVLRWEAAYARQYGIFYWSGTAWQPLFWTNSGDGGIDTITVTSAQARYIGMYGIGRGTPYGYSLYEFEVYNNLSVLLPLVPPDPEDKPLEEGIEPLIPLAPVEEGKLVTLLGDGESGQEDMPLAEGEVTTPAIAIRSSIPTAHLLYPSADGQIEATAEQILFQGIGADNDENGEAIVEYRWTSTLDGQLGTTATFTLARSTLSIGTHIITFAVRDNEGEWSEPVTTTLIIDAHPIAKNVYLPIVNK